MGRWVRLAVAMTMAASALVIAVAGNGASATSCMVTGPSELLASDEAGLTIFIGTVAVPADPVQFTVDAVLKGELGGEVEVRIVDDFSADVRQKPPAGSVLLVAALPDVDGTLVAGACALPQQITSRDEAEQLIALAPEAQVRSSFEHLPPASMLRLGVAAPADPSPVAPSPSAAGPPTAPALGTRVPGWAAAAIFVGGGTLAIALWLIARRQRAALGVAAATGAAVLLTVAMSTEMPPAGTEPSSPAARLVPSAAFEPLTLPPPPRTGMRDGPGLAELLDRAGLSCVMDESQLDNWRSWECGGIATPNVEVLVSMWSNFADHRVVGYSVTYTHRGDDPILDPIDPAEFRPFTDFVLDPAGRDQVGDWLASTWAISTISTEFDAFHARRFGASINLDLRFTAP